MARYTFLFFSGLIFVLSARECDAQKVASFDELWAVLKPGEKIRITDIHGGTAEGKFDRLSDSSIRLLINESFRDFASNEIAQVERRKAHAIRNGAIGGGVVGLGVGAVAVAAFCAGNSLVRCSDHHGGAMGTMGIFAGIGAGLGAAIEAVTTPREALYRSPKQARLSLAPFSTEHDKGVRLSISF